MRENAKNKKKGKKENKIKRGEKKWKEKMEKKNMGWNREYELTVRQLQIQKDFKKIKNTFFSVIFSSDLYKVKFKVNKKCWLEKTNNCNRTMYAITRKPLGIYPHMCVSTWSVIRPLTLPDIYKILHNVAHVLMSVLHLR